MVTVKCTPAGGGPHKEIAREPLDSSGREVWADLRRRLVMSRNNLKVTHSIEV